MLSSAPRRRSSCRLLPAFACAAMAVAMAGCATSLGPEQTATSALGEAPQAAQRTVRIAMLLPISGFGPTAAIAKGMKQAGEMALFELDNPNVQLVVKDDKGSPEGAEAAAVEAIGEGVEIIVGPLTAAATRGAAGPARKANVPILSFSNDRNVAGGGVYLMSFLAEQEIERIVSFAAAQGKRRIGALVPADAYGHVVEPALRAEAARLGVAVAILEPYPPQANAMLGPAKRVVDEVKASSDTDTPIDALLLAGGQDVLPHLGPIIAYSGLDTKRVKLLGTGAWEYQGIGRETALLGGWYPGPDPRGWQDFSGRFTRSFGAPPPRLASLAYDAVSVAVALSQGARGERYTAVALTRPSGFSGVDGIVRFRETGLPDRDLAVLEVKQFGSTIVDPPKSTPLAETRVSAAPRQ